MYLNPLINFTIAFVVFGETINSIQLIGYAIIAVALVVFNYQNFAKLKQVTMG
jgi:chloramphenicol-sensitive protein RarD